MFRLFSMQGTTMTQNTMMMVQNSIRKPAWRWKVLPMRSELAKLHLSMNLDKTEKCCWYQILRLITEAFDFSVCQFITVHLVIFNTFSCFHCVCWDRQSLSHDICFTRRSIDHCGGPWFLLPSWLDSFHDTADSRWSLCVLQHLKY